MIQSHSLHVNYFGGKYIKGTPFANKCDTFCREIISSRPRPLQGRNIGIKFVGKKLISVCSDKEKRIFVNVSYLFLINPEEIPEKFKANGKVLDYQELETRKLLKDFFFWTQEVAGKGKSESFDIDTQDMLRIFLKIWQLDPLEIIYLKRFLINHEFGHVVNHDHLSHTKDTDPTSWKNITLLFLFIALAGGIDYLLYKPLHVFSNWNVLSLYLGIGPGGTFILYKCRRNAIKDKKMEFLADTYSAKVSEESRKGGILFCNILKELDEEERNSSCCFPNIFFDFQDIFSTHPSGKLRLKALEEGPPA